MSQHIVPEHEARPRGHRIEADERRTKPRAGIQLERFTGIRSQCSDLDDLLPATVCLRNSLKIEDQALWLEGLRCLRHPEICRLLRLANAT